ncbi:hypothetical protein R1flu_001031 [Riccia fluitans]|uniref:Secreted protein n=1 Tax=Riccia fluitans TaxID=41844 RepID=A0ABD1Y251_9MARC
MCRLTDLGTWITLFLASLTQGHCFHSQRANEKAKQDASQSWGERLLAQFVSVPRLNTRDGVVWGSGPYGMEDGLIISCKVFRLSSMYDYTRGAGGGRGREVDSATVCYSRIGSDLASRLHHGGDTSGCSGPS